MATHSSVLAGESQRQGSLVGCRLWGHTEADTTEVTQHSIAYKCGETQQEAVTMEQEAIKKQGMIKFVIYSESRVCTIYLSLMRVTNE